MEYDNVNTSLLIFIFDFKRCFLDSEKNILDISYILMLKIILKYVL